MSSRSNSRLLTLCTGVGLFALVGCDRRANDGISALGATPPPAVVGPTPGPHADAGKSKNPYADDPAAINAGRLYYTRYNCAGCHGDHGGGGMGPSHRDQTWLYGKEDEEIFRSIADGRGKGMPEWGSKVPDEVIWKLVAYIKTMRTPAEPEAPDQTVPAPPQP